MKAMTLKEIKEKARILTRAIDIAESRFIADPTYANSSLMKEVQEAIQTFVKNIAEEAKQ